MVKGCLRVRVSDVHVVFFSLSFFFFISVYFREAALPLGWTMQGREIYFSLTRCTDCRSTEPNHIHSSQWKLAHRLACCKKKKAAFFEGMKMENISNNADILSQHEQVWVFMLFWVVLYLLLTAVVFVCAVTGYNGNERIWAIALFPWNNDYN